MLVAEEAVEIRVSLHRPLHFCVLSTNVPVGSRGRQSGRFRAEGTTPRGGALKMWYRVSEQTH
jgi:hypothetical protein